LINLLYKLDEVVKTQNWYGKVKSSKCKAYKSLGMTGTYRYVAMIHPVKSAMLHSLHFTPKIFSL